MQGWEESRAAPRSSNESEKRIRTRCSLTPATCSRARRTSTSTRAALKFANFDVVSANYDVKGTVLESKVKRYVVRTLGGIRIGLFGLGVSPTALITPENFKGVTFIDPVVAAREVVKKLRDEERCA